MDLVKFIDRVLLIGGFGIPALIFGFQLYGLANSGEWNWLVLGDIFPSWVKSSTSGADLLHATAQWFVSDLWLGFAAIIPFVLWSLFTSRHDGDFTDFGGFE